MSVSLKLRIYLTLSVLILIAVAFFCGQWYAQGRVGIDYVSRVMYDNLAWRYAYMSIAAARCLGGWGWMNG